jgi:hypothetical protein
MAHAMTCASKLLSSVAASDVAGDEVDSVVEVVP